MVNKQKHLLKKSVKDFKVISEKKSEMQNNIANEQGLLIQDNLDKKYSLADKYKDYKILDLNAFKTFLVETKDFLFGTALQATRYVEENQKNIEKQIKKPIRFGLMAIYVAVGFFGVWACLAPLDSAINAQGYFRLSEHRKIITHHEGGIVEQILIKDGDMVKKNQPLIILNNSKAKAEMNAYRWQLLDHYMIHERLQKKLELLANVRENHSTSGLDIEIEKPQNEAIDYSEKKVLDLYNQQASLFNSYKTFLISNIETLQSRIEQRKSEIESVREKISSNQESVKLYLEEFQRVKKLIDNSLATKDKFSEIKSRLQLYQGEVKENLARLAQTKHQLAESELSINAFLDKENVESYEEFKENQKKLNQTKHQYINALDIYERTIIRSPYDGEVADFKITSIGQSLYPGGGDNKLLDIIPKNDSLIIESEVMSKDIDSVVEGGIVKIQLNAYKSRTVPRIDGKVIYVSPDKFDKPPVPSGHMISFYKVKIEVLQSELDRINYDINLKTGMPVNVFIVKGTRTFAEYLYSPIVDSFHRAFIEE